MNSVLRVVGCVVILLLAGCAHGENGARAGAPVQVRFVGSTPGGAQVREFLGGLAATAECHSISWELTLLPAEKAQGGTWEVAASYHVPAPENTNRSVAGPRITLRGRWEVVESARPGVGFVTYRVKAENAARSVSFARIGGDLLHLLDNDGSLAVGTGGWSYTLSRADAAERSVEPAVARTVPDMSYRIDPLATGPFVFAVFEGRTPCHGIAGELKLPQHAGCTKAKWRVTLYQDPATRAPATYKVEGTLFRESAREGTWRVTHGAKVMEGATVYELHAADSPTLLLFQADENVLFFLNQQRELMVGHAAFSYTLNRARAARRN